MGWVDVPRAFHHIVKTLIEMLRMRFPEWFTHSEKRTPLIFNYLDDILAASPNRSFGIIQHALFLAAAEWIGMMLQDSKREHWGRKREVLGITTDLELKEVAVSENSCTTLCLMVADEFLTERYSMLRAQKIAGTIE